MAYRYVKKRKGERRRKKKQVRKAILESDKWGQFLKQELSSQYAATRADTKDWNEISDLYLALLNSENLRLLD